MIKKSITLISAIAIFMLTGCAEDQYAIEKRYYHIQKQAEKIFKNPHASPPNELENVVNVLNGFSKKYPKSNLAVNADFTISRLYIVKEEFEKARAQLAKIIGTYSKQPGICSEAVFLKGNSYEMQDKWSDALAEYKKIMLEYPTTLRGMDIPIYIIQHYKVKFQPDKMNEAAKEAVQHYKNLAEKYPGSVAALRAQTLIAESYAILKDWQGVIGALNTIIENYKGKMDMDGVLMNIAIIYNRELNDPVNASRMLERLIQEYPKSKLVNTANSLLKKLKETK